MGYEQIKAANLYLYGEEGRLGFEDLPVQGSVTTRSASSSITDSAAAATAMATGHKVNNGVISKAIPGDGSSYKTALETHQDLGKSTGIVTTAMISHATPAAFISHNTSRENYEDIAVEIFNRTKPDVLFGGGGISAGIDSNLPLISGYAIAFNEVEMNSLSGEQVCALFGDGHMPYVYDGLGEFPTLAEMSLKALELLDTDYNGFFLMIEGARIDHACHDNDLQRMIFEMESFSDAVTAVRGWVGQRDDILLIVTADHETGGLDVIGDNGEGNLPTVSWSTVYHTGVNIPFYIQGEVNGSVGSIIDNTDIYDFLIGRSIK